MLTAPEKRKIGVDYTKKFSRRFTEIAILADNGDDEGYGVGLARLEMDILKYVYKIHKKNNR